MKKFIFRQRAWVLFIFCFAAILPAYTDSSPDDTDACKLIFRLANLFHATDQLDASESTYEFILNMLDNPQYSNDSLKVKILINYSSLLSDRGKNEASLRKSIEAAEIAERTGNKAMLAVIYHNIGGKFNYLQQYDKAIEYFEKSIKYRRYTSDLEGFTLTYLNMSTNYGSQGNIVKMRQYLDSASVYNAKIDNPYTRAVYTSYEGQYSEKIGNREKAITYYKKALEIAENNNLSYQQFDILGLLYNLSEKQLDYGSCKRYILQYYELANKIGNADKKIEALDELSYLSFRDNNYKEAYEYLQEFVDISDSVQQKATQLQLNKLETEFDRKSKQQEIENLQKENLQKAEILKLNNQIYIGAGILFILLLASGYLFFRNKQYKHDILLKEIKRQKEKETASALIQGQENERQRIARDLHDGLGGMLSSIKYNLQGNNPDKDFNPVSMLDSSIEELRRISHNLTPVELTNYGLNRALKTLCKRIENKPPEISLEIDEQVSELNLQYAMEISIYRITQELINNARKHAEATHLFIQLLYNENVLFLSVEDDGTGFDPEQLHVKGIGLKNIQDRIDYLNGRLNLQSSPGNGTCVYIEFDI